MNRILPKLLAIAFLLLVFQNIKAQNPSEEDQAGLEIQQERKHGLHIEAGGRTLIFGSLNYEYAFHRNFSVGAGLGMIYFQQGDIIRNVNGVEETGRYRDVSTSQMLYGNYFIGKNRHRLLITAGLTNFLTTVRNKYPTGTERSIQAQVQWNAGIGYQLSIQRVYLRATAYCISMPEPTGWFPKYVPWAGISAGVRI